MSVVMAARSRTSRFSTAREVICKSKMLYFRGKAFEGRECYRMHRAGMLIRIRAGNLRKIWSNFTTDQCTGQWTSTCAYSEDAADRIDWQPRGPSRIGQGNGCRRGEKARKRADRASAGAA